MTRILATNIVSPLGMTTEENFEAVRQGRKAFRQLERWKDLPIRFCAACFTEEQRESLQVPGFTWFESLIIRSVTEALGRTDIDPASGRTLFVLSTTLGNVDELSPDPATDGDFRLMGDAARKVARYLGIRTEPVVVCNACVSGVTAQLLSDRLIRAGHYDRAIVCGADTVSPFIVAVFSAFQSLSPGPCRPFDIERLGLNIGEGASTVILGRDSAEGWHLLDGYLDNDAYHVSAPDPTGDGVRRVIEGALEGRDRQAVATVSVHGTGTMFNDEMESKAIAATGLGEVPISSYKGFFGHTMGACGLLEGALAMHALDAGVILPAGGFEETGVSGRMNLDPAERPSGDGMLLKIVSGFGGCNGAALYSRRPDDTPSALSQETRRVLRRLHCTPDTLSVDGEVLPAEGTGQDLLAALYRTRLGDNIRFFKMDPLSRLNYLCAGLLLKDIDERPERLGILLFSRTGAILADRRHLGTFMGTEGFYPSPAVCINTLPNVVFGEIAARYGVKGETTFLILPERDDARMEEIISATLAASGPMTLLAGWADCSAPDTFEADLRLIRNYA